MHAAHWTRCPVSTDAHWTADAQLAPIHVEPCRCPISTDTHWSRCPAQLALLRTDPRCQHRCTIVHWTRCPVSTDAHWTRCLTKLDIQLMLCHQWTRCPARNYHTLNQTRRRYCTACTVLYWRYCTDGTVLTVLYWLYCQTMSDNPLVTEFFWQFQPKSSVLLKGRWTLMG